MIRISLALSFLALAGCSTPKTVYRNPTTGQVATCGGGVVGSLAGGVIGYQIEANNDRRCEADYLSLGFQRVR